VVGAVVVGAVVVGGVVVDELDGTVAPTVVTGAAAAKPLRPKTRLSPVRLPTVRVANLLMCRPSE
jgi:hypothetical protein